MSQREPSRPSSRRRLKPKKKKDKKFKPLNKTTMSLIVKNLKELNDKKKEKK